MPHYANEPGRYAGERVNNGHCVRFCQVVCPTLPPTSQWRRGAKVRGGAVPALAIIATFGTDGRYTNRMDGSAHACVLIRETVEGLEVWDQWQGQPVHRRTIRFHGGQGPAVNDGDLFYLVESEPERVSAAA